jgi:hypothetical protein
MVLRVSNSLQDFDPRTRQHKLFSCFAAVFGATVTKGETGRLQRVAPALFVLAAGALPLAFAQTRPYLGSLRPPVSSNAVFATEMKCDGATDDTSRLQLALTPAVGPRPTRLILPQGTCLLSATTVTLPDNIWLLGAGKLKTTLKRKDAVNAATNILDYAGPSGHVVLSDLSIDGNKSRQSTGKSSLGTAATAHLGGITIRRVRFLNAYLSAIGLFLNDGQYVSDFQIADSDFEDNGVSTTQDRDQAGYVGDISIRAPLRGRIHHNRAEGTRGNFVCFGTAGNTGVGNVRVDHNVVSNATGFGVALGGGGGAARGALIDHNTFIMPDSRENIVDLALWTDTVTSANTITSGSCDSGCAAIGDGPPADRAKVIDNRITANPALNSDTGIVLGGSDVLISGNTVSGAGSAGIVILVLKALTVRRVRVENNVVKNCSVAAPGLHPGIDTYIEDGGIGTLSDVVIKGNRSYDDQPSPTQAWGIGIGAYGQSTGYANITVQGNDLRRNKAAGLLNHATSPTGFVIRDNRGSPQPQR